MNRHTKEELQSWQKLPLEEKIRMTKMRIAQWYRFYDGDIFVAFSGGKDSTVLMNMCREMYDFVDAVHVNTGLEYPEIEQFVNNTDNVTILKPKHTFRDVVCKYGYPMFSKEVSECVSGARKYLTSLLNDKTVLTDRQTDRTATSTTNLLEQEHIRHIRNGTHHIFQYETDRLLGTIKSGVR